MKSDNSQNPAEIKAAPEKLSVEQVDRLARLARLEIEPGQHEQVTTRINSILAHIQRLQSHTVNGIAASSVEPMSHVHGVTNVMREDQLEPHLGIDALLKIVPEHAGRLIKTPIVIEQE